MRALIFGLGIALSAFSLLAFAQEGFGDLGVAGREGTLHILVNGDMAGRQLTVLDANKDELDKIQWDLNLPLVRSYELPSGPYQIGMPGGPINFVSVVVPEQGAVYLQITPTIDKLRGLGIAISAWEGSPLEGPPEAFSTVYDALVASGEESLFKASILDDPGGVIYLSTEPPWPIPPKPEPGPPPPQ